MAIDTDLEILDLFIEHSDQIFIITDTKYKISKISHNWEKITGLQRHNSIGTNFTDYIYGSDRNLFVDKTPQDVESPISLKFKDLIIGFCCKIIVNNNSIKIILRNCNELLKLQNSENNLSKLLNSVYSTVPFCMGIVKDRTILEVNQYMCDLLGYRQEELINKSARILYPDDYHYNYVGSEKYKILNIKGKAYLDTKWIKKNGTIIDVVLVSTYIDLNNKSIGAFFLQLKKIKISDLIFFNQDGIHFSKSL
jgi:PAS domain S-box-containing protein